MTDIWYSETVTTAHATLATSVRKYQELIAVIKRPHMKLVVVCVVAVDRAVCRPLELK